MKRIQLENRSDLKAEIPLEAPYSLFIDPSTICNFKCKFCMNSKIEKPKVMDFTLYKKIIDDLQEFKTPIKVIRLYGFGEPLVNTNFCDMVKYAKKSDKVLSVDTTTNGSLIDKAYAEKLIMSGIDRINISIEGVNSDQYKKFTGCRIDFDKMIKNFEYLYKIRNKTTIFMKICGDYLTEAEKAEFYRVFEPISDGCDIEHTMSCWYDCQVENVNTSVGIYGQPLDDMEICPYPLYSFTIHPDCQAVICFLDWNKKIIIGDVRKQSVKEIWDSEILKNFQIMMLTKKRKNHPICKDCQQPKFGMAVNLDKYSEKILKRLKK